MLKRKIEIVHFYKGGTNNKLYVLGTGQAVVKHYHNTCFVLSDGEDYFLVDGGGGGEILKCMDQMKIPWERHSLIILYFWKW